MRQYLAIGLFGAMLLTGGAFASGKNDNNNNNSGNSGACSKTAIVLRLACITDLGVNFGEASANCLNISDPADRKDCYTSAQQDMADSRDECGKIYSERQSVCSKVGQAPYEPAFGGDYATNFVDPLEIGKSVSENKYFPLKPGDKWIYKSNGSPQEIDTVTVSTNTKSIQGVTCVVVHDIVSVNGVDTEVTDDWYGQDMDGNVWYCGESSRQQQAFPLDNPPTPELIAIDGSWKAGENDGKAGIVMAADPQVGETRRLELMWGEAEDVNTILAVDASESTPGGSCTACLQTLDYTALDAGTGAEHKYYEPGVGVILEVDLDTGVRNELQSFVPAP